MTTPASMISGTACSGAVVDVVFGVCVVISLVVGSAVWLVVGSAVWLVVSAGAVVDC